MEEKHVTFTVLEDGFYTSTLDAVVPAGEYPGRIIRRDGKVSEVYVILQRATLEAIGISGAVRVCLITREYQAGMIGEDRV